MERVAPEARRGRRGVLVTALVLDLLVAWAAVVGLTLCAASADARSGERTVDAVRARIDVADLLDRALPAELREAEASFDRAARLAGAWWMAPARLVPFVGRQVRSVDALASGAREVAGTAAGGLERAQALVGEGELPDGAARVTLLRDLAAVADYTGARLAAVDLGPSEGLVASLAEARRRVAQEVGDVTDGVVTAGEVLAETAGLLEGRTECLLLAANNAEMRAGSGMLLSAGLLTMQGGDLSVGDMTSTADLGLEVGVAYRDADLEGRWGWAEPNREWRNLALTPRFDVTAEMAARMWVAAGGEPVEGVVAVDVAALQALLRAMGPVVIDDVVIGADNVTDVLLSDQYAGIVLEGDEVAQAERHDLLSRVTQEVVRSLDGDALDLTALAEALRTAVDGRHLMVWSADPAAELCWEDAGVAGAVPADAVAVNVVNDGRNKLDQFLRVEAHLEVGAPADGAQPAQLAVRVTNESPEALLPYVEGLRADGSGTGGVYPGLLTVTLPGFSGGGTVDSVDRLAVVGRDGDARVLAVEVDVPQAATVEYLVRFDLPTAVTSLEVVPSARIPPVRWLVDGQWHDEGTFTRLSW